MALLGFHEQDLVFRRPHDLRRLGHGRGIDPIFGVHEEPSARADRLAGFVHLLHHPFVHDRLGHMPADRRAVVRPAEIPGERLLTDHVLARAHARDDHFGVQRGRRADVDDVDAPVGQKFAIVAKCLGNAEPLGEVQDVVAA